MSYQVLARRWRPKLFADVVGQEHVTRTLQNALRQGRLAHAFLFTGPRGVGKTSTARILARAVNCPNAEKNDFEPCNKCETCLALLEDRELDVIEMDAASYTGVDDIRSVIDSARLAPIGGRKKVFIIDEVHMLSKNAFNAFLKTLEEPPSHVIFVLATTDVQKVPATILSRVQRFDFRPVQPQDIEPHLEKICTAEKWDAEPEALWLIARRAEGSLRDAEGLLDQVVSFGGGGKISYEQARQILGVLSGELLALTTELVAEHRLSDVPPFFDTLVRRGVDYSELLRSLQAYWMDLVFLKEGLPLTGKPEEEVAQMKQAGGSLAIEDVFRLIRLAEALEDGIKWSTAPRVRFEVAFLRWVTMDRAVAIKDILTRLDSKGNAEEALSTPPAPVPMSSTSKSATKSEKSSAAAAASEVQVAAAPVPVAVNAATLEDLRALWPEIVKRLQKRSPAAAALAESVWEMEQFDGRRLVMRCKRPGMFYAEQLKANFPHLTAAIQDVAGIQVVPVSAIDQPGAARPIPAPVTKVAETTPVASVRETGNSDLFSNFVNRIGGVEVDPKTLRGPKSSQ